MYLKFICLIIYLIQSSSLGTYPDIQGIISFILNTHWFKKCMIRTCSLYFIVLSSVPSMWLNQRPV